MKLQPILLAVSETWVAAHKESGRAVTLETLSSRATTDAKLFKRLKAGRPIFVGTMERLLTYIAEPDNWPTRVIPLEAAAMLQAPLVMHLRPEESQGA